MTNSAWLQAGYAVRFDWGPSWANEVAGDVEAVVVVDVLSFTTSTTIAVDRGASVIPYDLRGEAVETVAAQFGATIAGRRGSSGPTLSPASLVDLTDTPRLVLPSPNGSKIASSVAGGTAQVFAGCLRNTADVAEVAATFESVAVVASGERWPDGTLRPAVEDLWGAGAILAAIEEHDIVLSPEAAVAADAYRVVAGRLAGHLLACASGQELIANGFERDVALAAEVDVCRTVPTLREGAFVAWE